MKCIDLSHLSYREIFGELVEGEWLCGEFRSSKTEV